MLTLYTANTPNGQKINIALEELGLPHKVHHVNLSSGEQHQSPFSEMSPNHKIPLLLDGATPIFESGAILIHLADKAGKLLPASGEARSVVLQWLFLQVGSIGPMLGQLWFFRHGVANGSPRNEQALERYGRETMRLFGVFEERLRDKPYLAGDEYTIADIASFPWIRSHHELGITLGDYPAVADWVARIEARPAVQRGLAAAKP
ncbi:glutathione S-transferase family protein [Pseudoduganella sp. OTU4001]|uniref:glutathione S-transferase family protein n=1 Tax=Pseudoduganella sp. OTU4001 TaxID=3043854 RepID=UPI00313E8495